MRNQKGLAPILIVLILAALVGGYLVYQNYPKPTSSSKPTNQPSPTPDASPAPNGAGETATWKTYTNNQLSISFEYSPNWVVKETNDKTLEIKPKNYNQGISIVNLFVYSNPGILSLNDLDKKLTGPSGMGPQLYSQDFKKLKLQSGVDAYYGKCTLDGVTSDITDCEQYVIPYKQKVFQLRNAVNKNIKDQKETFDQILSTFKFLP